MPEGQRISIYLTDDEVAIANAIADRLKMTRSTVFRHLLLYQAMCGGDFPLTKKIIGQPDDTRDRIIAELRKKVEAGETSIPQRFREWVKETTGSDDAKAMDMGGEALLRKLVEESKKREAE